MSIFGATPYKMSPFRLQNQNSNRNSRKPLLQRSRIYFSQPWRYVTRSVVMHDVNLKLNSLWCNNILFGCSFNFKI